MKSVVGGAGIRLCRVSHLLKYFIKSRSMELPTGNDRCHILRLSSVGNSGNFLKVLRGRLRSAVDFVDRDLAESFEETDTGQEIL